MENAVAIRDEGLLPSMARRYRLAPDIFERTVAVTAMPQKNGKPDCSREELISCLMVAHEHNLNPLTKEIYFMRTKSGQIQPIVGVDGWVKKLNEHPAFDGMEFEDAFDDKKALVSVTCVIHRKDRAHPVKVTEYLKECLGSSPAWSKTPARMLRHRVLTQAARYAVGFAGVMDHDEFDQWQADPVRRNASQTKKSGDMQRFEAECRACTTVEELTAKLEEWKPNLQTMPETWEQQASDFVAALHERLSATVVDAVEPLADEAGYLDKLQEDRGFCNSETDLAELKEANADLIARLSPAGQARAAEILEVE